MYCCLVCSLYSLDINPLADIKLAKCFFPILLAVSSLNQLFSLLDNLFSFIRPHLSIIHIISLLTGQVVLQSHIK